MLTDVVFSLAPEFVDLCPEITNLPMSEAIVFEMSHYTLHVEVLFCSVDKIREISW